MDEAAAADEPASPTVSTSSSSASTSKTLQRPMAKASSASSLEGKKGLHFGPFRLTLPRTKKNKTMPTDDVTHMNPPKKVKREKSFLRSLTSKKSTSALGKVKEKKSTSSIASTLVRKISFAGKTKGDKEVGRVSARSETSPATSQEELDVGTAGAGSSRPSTPMELDSTEAAAAATTAADAVDVDVQATGGVELAGTGTNQSVSIVRAAYPLLVSPVERAHLVEVGTGTGTGTDADTSLRAAGDEVGSPSALRQTYVSQNTSKLRAAWMSLPESASADATGDEPGPAKTPGKTTREQILNITAPAWESQQREKRRRQAKVVGAEVTDADAEAGTSHSEGYSTPSESAEADAPAEQSALTLAQKTVSAVSKASASKSALESEAGSAPTSSTATVTPPPSASAGPTTSTPKSQTPAAPTLTPTLTPSEDILAGLQHPGSSLEETVVASSDATGEDLMAEARARLSQSLGVNAPPASPSVQQGGGGEKREHLYKILVIGELGTGKTSIIKRYVHQFFSQHYRATIGVDFALKVLNWDANTIIRLQLWDIAGQERFGNMTRVYYKEAVAAFVVFDVTRQATFDAVLKWKQDLDSKVQLPDGSAIPCILLANKCDLQKEGLVNYPSKMDEYCKDRGFAGWFEISAKENVNIEEAARLLVTKILANEQAGAQEEAARDADKLHLGTSASPDDSRSKCSC